jgi:hypothetical protein
MDQSLMLDENQVENRGPRDPIQNDMGNDKVWWVIFQELESQLRMFYNSRDENSGEIKERYRWGKKQWQDESVNIVKQMRPPPNRGRAPHWTVQMRYLGDWQAQLKELVGETYDLTRNMINNLPKSSMDDDPGVRERRERAEERLFFYHIFNAFGLAKQRSLDLERGEAVEMPNPEAPESLPVRPADKKRKVGEEGGEFEPEVKRGPEYDPALEFKGSGPFDFASNVARNVLTPGVVEYAKKTVPGYLLDQAVTGGLPRLGDEIDRAGKNVQVGVDAVLDAKLPSIREGAQLLEKVAQQSADPIRTFNENVSIKNTNKFLDALIPVQYSDSAFRFLQKYGETMITRVTVRRAPIAKGLEKAFQLISQGNWEAGKKAAGYDSMFHLSLIGNGNLFFEKLSKIHLDDKVDKVAMSEYWEVAVPVPVSVNEMLERTRREDLGGLGDERYYKYDPFVNNCQQFVRRMLKVNNWLTPELEAWVVQPTEKILEQNPEYLSGFSLALTNFGAVVGLGVATRNGINFKKGMRGGKKDLEEKIEIQKSNPNVLRMLDELPDLEDIEVNPIQTPASPVPPPIPALQLNNRAPDSLPSTPGVG